ncbi:hypothetical protein V8C42DRAFT_358998 [Trichoderma barbatum]
MAKSVASGHRVEVQTAWGSQIPSTVILRLQIRNGDDITDFAVITLTMGQTGLPLNIDYLSATDEMKDMFPDPRIDHIAVIHSRFRDQDLEYFKKYGMIGTRLPTAYLRAVSLKSVRDFLPDIGTKVKVYLKDIAQRGYTFADSEVVKLALRLQWSLYMPELDASRRVWLYFNRRSNVSEKDKEDALAEHIILSAAVELQPYLHMPDKDDPQHKEAQKAGRRHLNVALFYVEVPRQRDWAHGLRKPPMTVDIADRPPPSNLQQFLVNAFTNQKDILRAEIHYYVDTELYAEDPTASPVMGNLRPGLVADDRWKPMVQDPNLLNSNQADQPRVQDGQQTLGNDASTRKQSDAAMVERNRREREGSGLVTRFGKHGAVVLDAATPIP